MLQNFTAIADVNGVVVGFAHLSAVGSQQFRDIRQNRFRNRKYFPVKEIKPACYFPGQLDMGKLINAYRNAIGFVHDNVGSLQHRITQETERR